MVAAIVKEPAEGRNRLRLIDQKEDAITTTMPLSWKEKRQ